jgi:hypothetical protein
MGIKKLLGPEPVGAEVQELGIGVLGILFEDDV